MAAKPKLLNISQERLANNFNWLNLEYLLAFICNQSIMGRTWCWILKNNLWTRREPVAISLKFLKVYRLLDVFPTNHVCTFLQGTFGFKGGSNLSVLNNYQTFRWYWPQLYWRSFPKNAWKKNQWSWITIQQIMSAKSSLNDIIAPMMHAGGKMVWFYLAC